MVRSLCLLQSAFWPRHRIAPLLTRAGGNRKANAIGRSAKTVREFLERNHADGMDRDAAIRLTVKSLLEVVQTGARNIEIAVLAPGQPLEMLAADHVEGYVKGIEQEKQEEAAKKKGGRTPGTGTAAILTRGGGEGAE